MGRHRLVRRTRRRRWLFDDALGWLDIEEEIVIDDQDLTEFDHLVENTEKDGPDGPDDDLVQPVQDPAAIPHSVVDENGLPA